MIAATHGNRRFQDLTRPRRCLLRLMQDVNFGRITFSVGSGEPDLDQPWSTRQTVKLAGGVNGPRSEEELADFELCREQVALFDTLRHIADGAHVAVEVRHGLPFLVEIEKEHQAA